MQAQFDILLSLKHACKHNSRDMMYNSDAPTKPFPPTTSSCCTIDSIIYLRLDKHEVKTCSIDISSSSSMRREVSNDYY